MVERKVRRFRLNNIHFVPGYFGVSFPRFDPNVRFSFAHLDVNLYGSYKDCLEFFYLRMVSGGVILFDEYNDPGWPGCNRAVDEFLADKPEKNGIDRHEQLPEALHHCAGKCGTSRSAASREQRSS
jgi:hypothetical protein